MRYVAAYMLAVLGGNASPKASDVESILGSVGIDADAEKVRILHLRKDMPREYYEIDTVTDILRPFGKSGTRNMYFDAFFIV